MFLPNFNIKDVCRNLNDFFTALIWNEFIFEMILFCNKDIKKEIQKSFIMKQNK